MSDAANTVEASLAPQVTGRPRIAWLVILALVALTVAAQRTPQKATNPEAVGELQRTILEIQGKYLVAAAQTAGVRKSQLYRSANSLNTGPLTQRLAFVVIAGELMGPAEALKQVRATQRLLDQTREPVPDSQTFALATLEKLYGDYQQKRWSRPSLENSDAERLVAELGWFGALALAPDQKTKTGPLDDATRAMRNKVMAAAWRVFALLLLVLGVVSLVGLSGLVGAVMFFALALSGRISPRFAIRSEGAGVYAETFAVWMTLLTGLSIAAIALPRAQEHRLLFSSAASCLSLAAIAWPMLRGSPWSQVRRDLGLFVPKRAWLEAVWGVICYVSNLPVMFGGAMVTLLLIQIHQFFTGPPRGFEQVSAPTHPVLEWVRQGGAADRVAIFVLACVIAPIVEETLFRGVLYQHLRNATRRWRTGASVLICAFINSLIFAIIHPQGLLAAPVLMSIAIGFSLAREWRGSLIAPMTMHAVNNGVMLTMLYALI